MYDVRGCTAHGLRTPVFSFVLRVRAITRRTERHYQQKKAMSCDCYGRPGLCAVARHESALAQLLISRFFGYVHVQDVELWACRASAKCTTP